MSFQPKLSAWYLDVDDKIDLIVTDIAPLTYQFHNIDTYRTWGLSLRNKVSYANASAGIGIALNGESKTLDSMGGYDNTTQYSVQFTGQASYAIPRWDLTFSAYYKYNGPQYQFAQAIENNETIIIKETQKGYNWLDISARKGFSENRIELTVGARNLLDVVAVETTSDANVGSSNRSIMLGYGRSVFIKLLYNLNL